MFKNPFSFEGRIRRTEYVLSYIISMFFLGLASFMSSPSIISLIGLLIFSIIAYWFLFSQGAKRCHDLGNNGWWQLIPFYILWLMFSKGDLEDNKYGVNPKNK